MARRLRAMLAVATVVVAGVGVIATASGGSRRHRATAALPSGWDRIERPISGVIYPRQVLAAATYPIEFGAKPRGCWPGAALKQMPDDGVLLQIVEYAPTNPAGGPAKVPRLPPRPRRFRYADATYARFECAGPSYKFDYEQGGRALQAQVWMKRPTVDPARRAEALRILAHFRDGGAGP